MKIAVIGAKGLVGSKMLQVLSERKVKYSDLLLAASDASVGYEMEINQKKIKLQKVEDVIKQKPDVALFSAGAEVSLRWAPEFAEVGTVVIDNSSAWRMDDRIPLVVPEVNGQIIKKTDKIIANPNCSTIQLVAVLAPLHRIFVLKRVIVSTYQSVSGSGKKGIDQMMNERKGKKLTPFYPHQIDLNVIPHGGDFLENGYTKEEMKLLEESRKILGILNLNLTATVVRVPVTGGHSESVNIEFFHDFNVEMVKKILSETSGIIVEDNPLLNEYPMPLNAYDRDEVFVGRIRRDLFQPKTLNMWIVSDNVRKGAATNAVQILEYMIKNQLID